MLSEIEQVLPSEIEKRSFEIITEELKEMGKILCPETELIVKRCIHTSADFEYADSLVLQKVLWRKQRMLSAEVCRLSQIHRWEKQELIRNVWQSMAVKCFVLCRMKMWQRWRKEWHNKSGGKYG